MKQRSSSFQISDILGLPPKENSSGDDAQTTIPPASISSALHSSNNPYVIFTGYSSSPTTESPMSPAPLTDPHHHHLSYSQINHLPAPLEPPPTTTNPINLTPSPPAAAGHHPNPPTGSHHLIHSKPSTGGYLPGNLNSSFLESSAAAAAHHYNNLFHGRWHMDNNSSDHYGEYTLSN